MKGNPVCKTRDDMMLRGHNSQRGRLAVLWTLPVCLMAWMLALAPVSWAEDPEEKIVIGEVTPGTQRGLHADIEDLKQDMVTLETELQTLEEALLYPSGTQVTVFLSMDVGTFFSLQSVELKLDDQVVATYLYTESQVKALFRGGMQRLYLGNLPAGKHELTAFYVGIGPYGREYRRAVTTELDKTITTNVLELKIQDSLKKLQPDFVVTRW